MVQQLRLYAPKAGGLGLIPGQGATSHMLQLRSYMLQLRLGAAKNKIKKELICKMGVLSYNL